MTDELETQAKEPFSEKRSRKTIKEWLEDFRHYFETTDSMLHYELFVREQIKRFIDSLLADPFLVEVEKTAQKLQEVSNGIFLEYEKYREEQKQIVMALQTKNKNLEADKNEWKTSAKYLAEELGKVSSKLVEANKILEEESKTWITNTIFYKRLRGILTTSENPETATGKSVNVGSSEPKVAGSRRRANSQTEAEAQQP